MLFAVLVVIILFGPVSRKIQDRVDKLFFRKKFSYRDTVTSVSNALSSMLKLDDIIGELGLDERFLREQLARPALEHGAPTYRFVHRYLERRPAPPTIAMPRTSRRPIRCRPNWR